MATSGGRELRNGPPIWGIGKLPVNKPRKRKGKGKEVPAPAYVEMQDRAGMGARMLGCGDRLPRKRNGSS